MIYVGKEKAEFFGDDDKSGFQYPIFDKDLDLSVIKINGRSPKVGYQTNTACKELLYIMSGSGTLEVKGKEEIIEFKKSDVILLDKNECYAFEGKFEALVPCTPAWTSEQHKYVD